MMVIINQLESLKGKKIPPLTFQLVDDGSIHYPVITGESGAYEISGPHGVPPA